MSSSRRLVCALAAALACCAALPPALSGCGVVDLGDNIVPPSNQLDEDFFFCQVQPNVINPQSCATGAATDTGGCHTSQSALLLEDASGIAPPGCDENDRLLPGEVAPDVYQRNLTRIRFTVASDPMSSPFYRRPLGIDSHPRVIYAIGSPEEMIVRAWITGGT
jgi:hypothetical protein